MSTYIRKDDTTHEQKEMPMLFPADRVYLDGDVNKNVQDALTWKRVSDTPSSSVDLTGINWNELYIFFTNGTSNKDTFFIRKIGLSTSDIFRRGFYESASNYADWGMGISNMNTISSFGRKNGVTQTTTIDVYYR